MYLSLFCIWDNSYVWYFFSLLGDISIILLSLHIPKLDYPFLPLLHSQMMIYWLIAYQLSLKVCCQLSIIKLPTHPNSIASPSLAQRATSPRSLQSRNHWQSFLISYVMLLFVIAYYTTLNQRWAKSGNIFVHISVQCSFNESVRSLNIYLLLTLNSTLYQFHYKSLQS